MGDPSETSIANGALALMGEQRITDLEAQQHAARVLLTRFDDVRDELLRAHPWNFATVRASLTEDATKPLWGFAKQFTLPGGWLRVIEVDDPARDGWRVEGGKILTSIRTPTLDIRYTQRIEDVLEMDPSFREALSAALAFDAAEAITGERRPFLASVAHGRLLKAAALDGLEPERVIEDEGVWNDARGRINSGRVIA